MSRRRFLKAGFSAIAASAVPASLFAGVSYPKVSEKWVSFYNLHTHESTEVCFFRNGRYDMESLRSVYQVLRDHRTGQVKPIDTRLLDLLHAISFQMEQTEPFHVISGYRSPATNARLRKNSNGVAANSLHMTGKAVDIRVPGCQTRRLKRTAAGLKAGGVGYYPHLDFVHVDVGPVRYWGS